MNDSNDTLELLTAFVDDELSADETNWVHKQMESDPSSTHVINAQRALKNLFERRLARYGAPPQLKQRIHTVLFGDKAEAANALPERRSFWQLFAWSPTTVSALGGVVLATVLGIVITSFGASRINPYVEDVHAHHMDLGSFPIQFDGNHETVAAKVSEATGFVVVVPHLGQGIDVEGGRKCTLCGHTIAFIKYVGSEGRLSFFVMPGRRPAMWRLDSHKQDELIFYVTKREEVLMAFWHDGEATYCLAGALPESRLMELASSACRQVQTARDASSTAVAPVWLAAAGYGGIY